MSKAEQPFGQAGVLQSEDNRTETLLRATQQRPRRTEILGNRSSDVATIRLRSKREEQAQIYGADHVCS